MGIASVKVFFFFLATALAIAYPSYLRLPLISLTVAVAKNFIVKSDQDLSKTILRLCRAEIWENIRGSFCKVGNYIYREITTLRSKYF